MGQDNVVQALLRPDQGSMFGGADPLLSHFSTPTSSPVSFTGTPNYGPRVAAMQGMMQQQPGLRPMFGGSFPFSVNGISASPRRSLFGF